LNHTAGDAERGCDEAADGDNGGIATPSTVAAPPGTVSDMRRGILPGSSAAPAPPKGVSRTPAAACSDAARSIGLPGAAPGEYGLKPPNTGSGSLSNGIGWAPGECGLKPPNTGSGSLSISNGNGRPSGAPRPGTSESECKTVSSIGESRPGARDAGDVSMGPDSPEGQSVRVSVRVKG